MKDGCVYRCLDPECNDATFDVSATCCVHCGNTKLRAEHPSSQFDVQRQAFICSHCGVMDNDDSLPRLRKMARDGTLDKLAPGFSALFDLTDH